MRFFYLLSPATWLKIALASFLLGAVSLFILSGYRINITKAVNSHTGVPLLASMASMASMASVASVGSAASGASASHSLPAPGGIPAPVVVHNAPAHQQNQAIAPEGILDQYAEFAPVLEFDDAPIKPDYVLPPPVAPVGLLDPKWTGVAP